MRKLLILAAIAALAGCSSSGNSSTSGSSGGTTTGSSSTSGSTGTTSSSSSTGSSGSTGSTGSCGAQGAACSPTKACCTGLACSPGLTCVIPDKEGMACDASVGCGNSLNCVSGVCHATCGTATVCAGLGDACGAGGACCSDLTCVNGACTTANLPTCKNDGDPCASTADCCGNASAGTQLACVPAGDGGSVCHLGLAGEPCDANAPCAPGLDCNTIPAPRPHLATTGSGSGSIGSSSGSSGSTSSSGSVGSSGSSASSSSGSTGASGSGSTGSSGSTGASGSTGSSGSSGSSGGTTGSTVSVCTIHGARPGGPGTCARGDCFLGDACDSQGVSYCSNSGMVCDAATNTCILPGAFQACSGQCAQTPGSAFPLVCAGGYCAPACNVDTDCTSAVTIDSANNNPPAISLFCDASTGTKTCQPLLCYDSTASNPDPSVLYQPCPDHANSRCEPQYYGGASAELGFCMAVRPNATNTVGQVCDPFAGPAYPDLLCGSDATCLGGVCQKVCDVNKGSTDASLACPSTLTCISEQGVNIVSHEQVGGCGVPCDPWTADEAASGCATFCGGPAAVCNWIIGDPIQGQPLGYCSAAQSNPVAIGGDCGNGQQCVQGAFCLSTQAGPKCIQLCDGAASARPQDHCPAGQACNLFQGFTHAGYCQ